MTKRAILYARVSRDDRGAESRGLKGQLDMCRQYAESKGWQIVAELAEDEKGASGASWDLPQLNKILDMARAGAFDVLVCREIDRLSRDLAKQLFVEDQFKRSGVEIAYALGNYDDTPEGNFMKNVRAAVAELERLKITERMVRGRRLKAQAGHLMLHGAPPYGYMYIGEGKEKKLAIDEQEAKVIRLIYDWYIDDQLRAIRIAINLSELGIPTPIDTGKGRGNGKAKTRGFGMWSNTTVGYILSNQTYAGKWEYYKNHRKEDPDQVISVAVPAIVSQERFDQAQERRKANITEASRNVKYDYLVRCRVCCGECGAAMVACFSPAGKKRYFYYRCRVGEKRTHYTYICKQTKHFRADHVDALVWGWVKSYLADPAKLAEGLTAYQDEHQRETAPLIDRLGVIDKLIAQNRGQMDRLLDLYLMGDFPKEALMERKARLAETIADLDKEREGLAAQLTAQSLTEDEIQGMFAFAAEVAQGLEVADEDFETRRRIIELLDVRATLAIEDGERIVYPSCRFWNGGRLLVVNKDISCFGARAYAKSPMEPA